MSQDNQPSHTYPPGPSNSPPEKHQQHAQHRPRLSRFQRSDLNQGNQDDPHYASLRARANEEGDKMARCLEESRRVYAAGDGAGAKVLSNERKAHKAKMDQLNSEASAWIYAKYNEDRAPGEIDLHGLYVSEAVKYSGRAIEAAQSRGDATINLIVGKGLHSDDGVAKLKPAITEMVQKRKLVAELDPDNAGVLVVQLGRKKSESRSTSAGEITRDPDNVLPPAEALVVQPGDTKPESRVTGVSEVTHSPVVPHGQYGSIIPSPVVSYSQRGRVTPSPVVFYGQHGRVAPSLVVSDSQYGRVTPSPLVSWSQYDRVTHSPIVSDSQYGGVTPSPVVSYSQYGRVTPSPLVSCSQYDRVTHSPIVPYDQYDRATPNPVVPYGQHGQATTGPPAVTIHVGRGYPIILGILILFSFIELAIAAWLVSMFNKHQNQLSSAVNDRARYLLFTSVWSVIGSSLLMVLFLLFGSAGDLFTSISVHLIYFALTWVFWTAGAGAITAALGSGLDCNLDYTYCGQLNALEAFAWIPWILTTFAVVAVLLKSISSHRQGDGWHGQFV